MKRLILCLLVLVSGCAAMIGPDVVNAGGYYWRPTGRVCHGSIAWLKRPLADVRKWCPTATTSCAMHDGCYVVSTIGEEAAKEYRPYGAEMTLWEHEVEWHLRRGMVHP